MRADEVERVAVIGGGTMGNGIAHVFAQYKFDVTLVDVKPALVDRAISTIEKNLSRQVKKGKLSEDEMRATLGRIATATDLEVAGEAQVVVEAITENPSVKFELFRRLDAICPSETVLASNTSSISLTEIAAQTGRAGKVVGMHFMNPVPVMKLVK